jgi:hypothetical protein
VGITPPLQGDRRADVKSIMIDGGHDDVGRMPFRRGE